MENQLNEKEVFKQYIDYHGSKFDEFGFDAKVVWNRKESQLLRFSVLARMFKTKSDFSVVDIGCGLADFYVYLKENGYSNIDYAGYEINGAMVEAVKKKYPGINVNKGSYDEILALGRSFDYVNSCGIHAFGENEESVQKYFADKYSQMYKITKMAMGINFLSVYSLKPDDMSVYHDPAKVLTLCLKTFGQTKVSLYHNYMPNDFTVVIDK